MNLPATCGARLNAWSRTRLPLFVFLACLAACTQPLPQPQSFAAADIASDTATDLGGDLPGDTASSDIGVDTAADTIQNDGENSDVGSDAVDVETPPDIGPDSIDAEQDLAPLSDEVDDVTPDVEDLSDDATATEDVEDIQEADVPIVGNLQFSVGPSDATAGAAIAPAIQVALVDDQANPLSATAMVTLAIADGPAGAKLSGTTKVSTQTTADGSIATFSNLSLDKAGTYYLTASAPGYGKLTSDSFKITASKATKLAFQVEPVSTAAGSKIAPAVEVAVQDAFGNLVADATTTIALGVGSGPTGAKLTGTNSADAVGGVAVFDELVLTKAGTAYTLVAFSIDLKSATSTEFAVLPGAPAQLGFLTQPGDTLAGVPFAPPVKVLLKDAYGNKITSASAAVTMSLGGSAAAGAKLVGTATVDAASGVAAFPDLSVDKVGAGYTLTASAAGYSSTVSPPFKVQAGAAAALAFSIQPKNVQAGSSNAVQVTVVDAFGNPVAGGAPTVELSIGDGPAGAILTGTTKAVATAGVASFADVRIAKAASGYTLKASATGLGDGTSASFDIGFGAATHLVVGGQPSDTIAGVALAPAVTIEVADEYGNLVGDANTSITLTLATNAGGATLSGTAVLNAVGGKAVFDNLILNKVGSGYTLAASASGLDGALTNPFTVLAGIPYQLAIVAEPGNAVAGAALSPSLQVALQDAFGNTVSIGTPTVTVTLGQNDGKATLSGTTSVQAQAGTAIFSGLSLDRAASGYTLIASAEGYEPVISAPFDVAPAAAAGLDFLAEPLGGLAGFALTPAVSVRIQDIYGNTVTSAEHVISLSLVQNPGSASLSGTTSIKAVSGIATFADLRLDKAAAGYMLGAQAFGLTPATSAAFDVTSGTPTRLAITVQPGNAKAGVALSPAIKVAILDAAGNPVPGATTQVTLSLASNPGDAKLLGTSVATAVGGIATFDDVRLDRADSGYSLLATASGLTSDTSIPFTVTAGDATQVSFDVQPVDATAGETLQAVRVAVLDAFDNPVTDSVAPISLALTQVPAGAVLNGPTTVNALAGSAQFSGLSIAKAGSDYLMTASANGLKGATSAPFAIHAAAPARLAFSVQPSSGVAGTPMSPAIEVTVQDAFGNATQVDGQAVTLAMATNPGGAALLGTATRPSAAGIASFGDISIDKVGSGYTIQASSGGLTAAVSDAFDVSFTLPTALSIAVEPTTTAAGSAMVPPVRVAIVDSFGNVVQGVSMNVTLALASNPGGAKFLGSATAAAIDGIATFNDLRLDKAATGYTLIAGAASLTKATTQPFDIIPGAPSQLGIITGPAAGVAGADLSPGVVVDILDAHGNRVTSSSAVVDVALLPAASAELSGTLSVAAVDGRATFDNLSIDKAGSYTIRASAAELTAASTASFAVSAGAPYALAFQVQPSNVAAGTAMSAPVKVVVLDAFGNTVSGATNAIVLQWGANPSAAALIGTVSAQASGGVATFDDVRIDRVAVGDTLMAASDGLVSAVSAPFAVTPGAATHLGFVAQPQDAIAGANLSPAVQVSVLDAFGNSVSAEAHTVTLSVAPPSSALVFGTAAVDSSNGIASFAALTLHTAGSGYALSATAPGLGTATSDPFDIAPGTPSQLGFVVQPSDGIAAVPLHPAIQVAVQDAFANTVATATSSIHIALGANGAGAVLTGSTTTLAIKGIATFPSLELDKAGSAFTLAATSSGLTQATSTPFAVTPGSSQRLVFSVQPKNGTAGAALPSLSVMAQDDAGVVIDTFTSPITVSLSANPGGSSLGGTWTVVPVAGVATFSNLTLDKAAIGYTLQAAAGGGVTAGISAPFDVQASAPAVLAFSTQPSNVASGYTMAPHVQVAIRDAFGNTVPSATSLVTVALATAPGATLAGNASSGAVLGIADFGDLSIDKAGTGYTLVASAAGLAPVSSNAFQVTHGAASRLSFTAQPGAATAGSALSPAVHVAVLDAAGNVVAGSVAPISLAIASGPAGATLSGTPTVSAVAGVASFANVLLTRAGVGYTLTATSGTLQAATSEAFDVTPAAASKLVFGTQPGHTSAGVAFAPALTVITSDAYGNTVASPATVNLALGANPGAATLSGVAAQTAAGIATFGATSLDHSGNGYTLVASAAGLGSVTSAPFNVSAGQANRLHFSVQPSNTKAGAAMSPAVKVLVEDAFGNLVTSAAPTIDLSVSDNGAGAALLSGQSSAAVAGIASFSNVSVDRVGANFTLTAKAEGLQSATSAPFAISAASAAKLAFLAQPKAAVAGAALAPAVQVIIQDSWGNTVDAATSQVNLAIANNAGGGSLSGTLSASAVAGIASFANLHIDKAASGYTLGATSGSLGAATSSAFDITFGAAARLAFSVQPSTATAGSAMTPPVKVAVQDAFGNLVTSATYTVSLGLESNPGGSTLAVSADASAGIATFSSVVLAKVGSGYTLSASASALTSATSNAFAVVFGVPDHLSFAVQPSDVTAGAAIAPVVKVSVLDANDNLVTTSSAAVTVTLGKNPGGATLAPATANASAGIASFANLSLDRAGSGYALAAASAGVTSAASGTFAVTPAAANRLAFAVQPADGVAGAALAPFQVAVQDAFGNAVSSDSAVVSLSVTTNPGGTSILAGGGATSSAGIATFGGTSLDKAASGYRLGASAPGLVGATSDTFAIVNGSAAKLALVVQPSDVAAGAFMSAVKVAIQDSWGNTVVNATDSVSLALSTNPTGALLSGGSAAANAGIATLDGVSLDKVGSGYKLTASSGTLTAVTSDAFAVTAGLASKLVFSVQPSDVVAGASMATVKVAIQDMFGNAVPTATHTINLSVGTNPGGAAILTGSSAAAVGGIATFTGISLDKAGSGYALSASAAGLSSGSSATFAVTPGAVSKLAFSVQPSDVAAGKAMASVKVAVQDAYGNLVPTASQTVQLSISANPAGATLLTAQSAAASAGIASFDAISLDKAGSGFKLGAAASGLGGATSAAFNVTAGDATKLAFAIQPSTTAADATLAEVTVSVRDAWDNPLSYGSQSISLTLGPVGSGGTLGGTTLANAVGGIAHFTTLKVTKVGSAYTLGASAAGLSGATSQAFDITPGAPAGLTFTKQPVHAQAGIAMAPGPVVTVVDAYGNVASSATNTVTLSIGTNPGGASLLDAATVQAVGGSATFDNIRLNKVGTGYTLLAAANGLSGATSAAFNLSYGTANQLAFGAQPSSTVAGTALPTMSVNVLDAYGNLVANASTLVTLDFATNPGGGTLSGAATAVNAVSGVATFSGVKVNKAGTGYQLSASASGPAPGTSASFDITFAAAAKLSFTKQPANTSSGVPLSPAVEVSVLDTYGNKVSSATSAVTIAIANNPSGANLSGTKTVNAIAGVASFADLSLDKVGSGYTFAASTGGLSGDTSSGFNVALGSGKRLVFTTQPSTVVAGTTFAQSIVVQIQDTGGNLDTTSTVPVTIALGTNPGSSTLGGTKTVNAIAGSATFSDLNLNKIGSGYTLSASTTAAGVTAGVSSPFAVTAAAAAKLAFVTQPASSITAGNAVIPGAGQSLQVVVTDSFDNPVTGSTKNIVLALDTNAGGVTLSGTTSVNASAGNSTASFSGALVNKTGSALRIVASSASVVSAYSTYFDVVPAAAAKLAFSVQPSKSVAGAAIAPAIKVDVQDSFGNVVSTSNDPVTLDIQTGPGGSTISGTTANTSSGTAVFSSTILTKAATGYKLIAKSGTLSSAISGTFDIDPGTATALAFGVQPSSAVSGSAISPAVTVLVRDDYGNTVTTGSAASASVTIGTASAPPSGTLSGTIAMAAVAGVGTFANLRLDKVGNYTLSAVSPGLAGATSSSVAVAVGTPAKLVFKTQPSNTTAGASVGNVQVEIRDANDNLCDTSTAQVDLAVKAGSGPGLLGGIKSVAAAGGVATFSAATISAAGGAYVLTATAGALTSADSTAFAVSAAAAHHLAYKVQPAGALAGATLAAVQVEVRDTYDNPVTTSTASISLAVNPSTGTGALLGTTTVSATAGVASFSTLAIQVVGASYKLTASSGILTSVDSTAFAITPAAASKLAFKTQPTGTTAGSNLATFQVEVRDAYNNLVDNATPAPTVNVSVTPGSGSGSLIPAASASVASAAGVATFTGLQILSAGAAYKITASGSGLTSADSSAFAISAGAAAKVAFKNQPTNTTAGATLATLQIEVRDAYDNLCTTATNSVMLLIASGPGTLQNATPVNAVNGVATFSGASLQTAGTYQLRGYSSALTQGDSTAFTVSPAAAYQLAFSAMPSSGTAGVNFSTSPAVQVQDQYGNTTTWSGPVTLGINTGSAGATLSGGGAVTAAAGMATWNSVSLDKAGAYTLIASASGLVSAGSSNLFISAASPALLAFASNPASSTSADAASFGTVKVEIRDTFGNLTTSTATVAISMNGGVGILSGTLSVQAIAGVATFSAATYHTAGSGYRLAASAVGLTGATSTAFAISAGSPTKLAFSTMPGTAVAGASFTPAPTVLIQDQYGNTTTSNASVSLATSTTPAGAILSGGGATTASSGAVTWGAVSVNKVGSYTFSAISAGLTSATSNSVTVSEGAAHHLVFVIHPSSVAADLAIFPTLRVEVRDANDNLCTTATHTVTVSVTGMTLTGTTSVQASAGVAAPTPYLRTAGTYTMIAAATGLASATSNSFTISAGSPAKLAFNPGPSASYSADTATLGTIKVEIRDAYDNLTGATNNVTISAGPSTSGLTGTGSATAATGTATFSGLADHTVGSGYTLVASTNNGINSATSTAFAVTPGNATKLAFTTQPTTGSAGQSFAPAFGVAVQDQYGNTATTSAASVTLALATTPPVGGTLTNGGAAAASSGIASWPSAYVNIAGPYTFTASASGLTSITSGTVNVSFGAQDHLTFTVQPGGASATAAAGASLGAMKVEVRDQFNNLCSSATNVITLAVKTGTGAGTLKGTPTFATAATGVATFNNGLNVQTTGAAYKLTATSGGLSGDSSFFSITPGGETHSAVVQQPSNMSAGQYINPPVTVAALDAYNNVVTTKNGGTVTVSTSVVPSSGALYGTLSTVYASGIATFDKMYAYIPGAYQLSFNDGVATANSDPFYYTVGAPDAPHCAVFSSVPNGTTVSAAGTTSQTLTATIADYYGNPISGLTVYFFSDVASDSWSATSAVTDEKGAASVDIGATVASSHYIQVKLSDGTILAENKIFFNAGAYASATLTPSTLLQYADGTSPVTCTLTVLDSFGNGVPSVPVALYFPVGTASMSSSGGATDGAGQFVTSVTSTTVGKVQLGASYGAVPTMQYAYTNPLIVFQPALPVISNLTSTSQGSCVSIAYTVSQQQGLPVELIAEYATDAAATTFARCTQSTGGNTGTVGVSTSSAGMSHTFGWNAAVDLPHTYSIQAVRLRAKVSGTSVIGNSTAGTAPVLTGFSTGTSTNYLSTSGARAVASGDMNGDGYKDMVLANPGGTVTVMLGNSSGAPTLAGSYSTGGTYNTGVAVGDFNRDGKLDVAVGARDEIGIGVMLGDGAGGLLAISHYGTEGSWGVTVGDVDNDGDLDIVANAFYTAYGYFVCLNNGSGTFTASATVAFSADQAVMILADLNRDGKLDLVFGGGTLMIGLGNGNGTFGTLVAYNSSTYLYHHGAAVGDVNRDGKLDILTSGDNYVEVWLGNGDGTVTQGTSWFASGTSQYAMALGDMDGDGLLDVAVASSAVGSSSVSLGLGNGDGTFQSSGTVTVGSTSTPYVYGLGIVDINGDGRNDLLSANLSGWGLTVKLNQTAGPCARVLSGTTETPVGSNPTALATGDFNKDGKPDAAVVNKDSASVSVLLGAGNGSMTTGTTVTTNNIPNGVCTADLNADGYLDLAVGNSASASGALQIFNGGSGGTFTLQTSMTMPAGVVDVACGDFNNDAKIDIVALHGSAVSFIRNNGANSYTFGTSTNLTVGATGKRMVVTDIDSDGKPDLLIAATNALDILNGYSNNGTFNPGSWSYAAAAVAASDVNADGNADIQVVTTTGEAYVSINNGYGLFATWTQYLPGTGSPVSTVKVADFTGDGVVDLALANYAAGKSNISILPGLSGALKGTFGTAVSYPVAPGPVFLGAADFNGDGRSDIASVNNNVNYNVATNTLGILLSTGTTDMRAGTRFATNSSAVASGDFNRDGRPDFATGYGGFTAYNSNGASYTASSNYATNGYGFGMCVADLNRDGKSDIVATNWVGGGYTAFSGDGSGTFTAGTYSMANDSMWGTATADFNRDGKPDVVIASDTQTALLVYAGNGTTSLGAVTTVALTANAGPRGVAIADFNSDGKPDIVVGNVNGTVTVATNTSNLSTQVMSFTTATYAPAFSNPQNVAAGDFNGDGKPDIIASNNMNGGYGVYILTNNGSGTSFAISGLLAYGSGSLGVQLADMNSDGKLDIVLMESAGYVAVGLNNGSGSVSGWFSFGGVGYSPNNLTVADFNRDGMLDVMTADYGGGSGGVTTLLYGR